MMTLDRFERLCAAYGGDLDRWPENEREAARALAEASDEARSLIEDAGRLDAALDLGRLKAPDTELARGIAASAPAATTGPAPRLAALAAALALTIGLGAGWIGAGLEPASDEELFTEAFGALDADEPDLLEDV